MANIENKQQEKNNLPQVKAERLPIPSIDQLYNDTALELAYERNKLLRLLNQPPRPEWIKVNKYANDSKYIPIGIIEYLLTSIYSLWRKEIKNVMMIANAVQVTIRLWILNPITGEWEWQEGVGAAPIITEKGAAATDFTKVTNSAVQMAVPAASSYALKDAAENLGKIFGKDLNRKDEMVMNYDGMLQAQGSRLDKKLHLPEELREVIKTAEKEELAMIFKSNREYEDNREFMELLNARREELNLFETQGQITEDKTDENENND